MVEIRIPLWLLDFAHGCLPGVHVLLQAALYKEPKKVIFHSFFSIVLGASAANNCKNIGVIQSAASAASARGGCASSRLDHGLKFHSIWGGCASASSRLFHEFSDCDKESPQKTFFRVFFKYCQLFFPNQCLTEGVLAISPKG